MIYNPFQKPISVDQAFIMAFKMHDRKHCNMFHAILAAFELRYQINFLAEHGITEEQFKEIIEDAREGAIIPTK